MLLRGGVGQLWDEHFTSEYLKFSAPRTRRTPECGGSCYRPPLCFPSSFRVPSLVPVSVWRTLPYVSSHPLRLYSVFFTPPPLKDDHRTFLVHLSPCVAISFASKLFGFFFSVSFILTVSKNLDSNYLLGFFWHVFSLLFLVSTYSLLFLTQTVTKKMGKKSTVIILPLWTMFFPKKY